MWLLTELKKGIFRIDDSANAYATMHKSLEYFYNMRQGNQETNDHYLARFKSTITAVELAGAEHLFMSPQIAGIAVHEMLQEKNASETENPRQ